MKIDNILLVIGSNSTDSFYQIHQQWQRHLGNATRIKRIALNDMAFGALKRSLFVIHRMLDSLDDISVCLCIAVARII